MFVDLAACTVLDEKTTEDTESSHPYDLAREKSNQHPVLKQPIHEALKLSISNVRIEPEQPLLHSKNITYLGILASAVPFLLPKPVCLPSLRAFCRSLALLLECIVTGFRMIKPSATSFRMVWRELALEISETSFGSSQIFRFPQPTTLAARRFWVVRLTL
jgi:hypothetical protein